MTSAELITLEHFELTRLFFAIVLLLVAAHFGGYLFHRFKLPRVIGEISGGLILGPTFLGHFSPNAYNWIFNAYEMEGKLISVIYWLGLIFLMFISGFEMQKSYQKEDKKTIGAILLGATVIPFIAGWLAPSYYDFTPYMGTANNMLALKIIIALAVAVTSIPVISKIFIDLAIIRSRFAKIVLAIATIQDAILWAALAVATGLVTTQNVSTMNVLYTIALTLAFFGISLTLMPMLINFCNQLRFNLLIKSSLSGYALFICFLFAAVASILKVNIVLGAFLAGIMIGKMPNEQFDTFKKNIKEISLAFFIPIYFAVVGLKIDLIYHFDFTFFIHFLLFSTIFETMGTLLFARFIKKDWLSSLNLSVAMNTRGGPGIILATIAFDMGIINQTFFTTLVLIAILTSFLAGYWFKYVLNKGWELIR